MDVERVHPIDPAPQSNFVETFLVVFNFPWKCGRRSRTRLRASVWARVQRDWIRFGAHYRFRRRCSSCVEPVKEQQARERKRAKPVFEWVAVSCVHELSFRVLGKAT